MNGTKQFEYKPSTPLMVICTLFFCGCAFMIFKEVLISDQGTLIERATYFVNHNTVYRNLVALASIAAVFMGLFAIYLSRNPRHILLGNECIKLPGNALTAQTFTVKFVDISNISISDKEPAQILTIHWPGKRLQIRQSMLTDKTAFDTISDTLRQHMPPS